MASVPAGFDSAEYLRQNPDVAAAGMDAAQHYAQYGASEGRAAPVKGSSGSSSGAEVMEYMSKVAKDPKLAKAAKMADKVQFIEPSEDEFQTYVGLGDAPTIEAPEEVTAETVDQPEIDEPAFTQYTAARLVEEPELTETEALASYEQISKESDAFQAAQLKLADVDPRATVQGQLALLQEQFAEGETPIWAQGAMRQATALMAQRGLGSSTMAAEAITNALMQSTIPIAQQDASFYQEVSLTNLANDQQAEMAKYNARVSAIFNDTAAENAARNINASSANELSQFYANLAQSVELSNTEAYNSMEQFNATTANQAEQFAAELGVTVDSLNAEIVNDFSQFNAELATQVSQFNSSLINARERFNVENQMAIDASNIKWRRDVNTANTSAMNAAIQMDVQNAFDLQMTALNNMWNHYDGVLNMTWKSRESQLDRAIQLSIATMQEEMRKRISQAESDSSLISSIFESGTKLILSDSGSELFDFDFLS